jgi:hypothetical protein
MAIPRIVTNQAVDEATAASGSDKAPTKKHPAGRRRRSSS